MAGSRTGNGATLTIPGNITATITRIGEQVFGSGDAIEDSNLASGRMRQYLPPDIYDHEFFDVDVVIQGNEIDSWLKVDAGNGLLVTGTITIQAPLVGAEVSGGDLTGSGWVAECTIGELANSTRWEGSLKLHWDGKTQPTWTDVA